MNATKHRKLTGVVLLLGLVVIVSGWWILGSGSRNQPEEGVLDVWTTWAQDPDQLQALFDRYSQENGLPVQVTTRVKSDKLTRAINGAAPPDIVVLSSSDLVRSYDEQGLVEPLDPWIESTGIDVEDIYPAPLAQCEMTDDTTLCLPWGCDLYALFWNKDLFAAAGLDPERPPTTMEELAEYAARLTVRDEEGALVQVGFVPDLSRSHTDLYAHMFGGSWTNDDGTALAVNARPMVDAAKWQRQFYDAYGNEEVVEFVSSFHRYTNSSHPVYAGKRLDCQQCHPGIPPRKAKLPDQGFYSGKVAMMVGGEWQVGSNYIPHFQPELDYGVAPFPPPAGQPGRTNTAVVGGAVVIIPAGAKDKEAGAKLLAWMMSPAIVAEEAYTNASLPTSRTAAQDPRFQETPEFKVFLDLLAHPNARHFVTTLISPELNQALDRLETALLHEGGDPVSLLDEVQARFASELEEALAYRNRP